jgi:hypothetical protein
LQLDVGFVLPFAFVQERNIEQLGRLLLVYLGMALRASQHDVVDGVPLVDWQRVFAARRFQGVDRSDDAGPLPKRDFDAAEVAF